MSATTSSTNPLFTEDVDQTPDLGGNAAGAAGSSEGGVQLSSSALIAIIVVVSIVAVGGIASSVLFYLAKKREWKIRETIRRSARKVVTALTPRRTEFPKHVKESRSRGDGRVRLDDVPPTPRLRPGDLEKGLAATRTKRADTSPKPKRSNFSRK
ncbi:hypothetical protein MCOR25_002473 [Pyricularia grisea]|uniref:Uncharacterized protein n=1 Tax=Pyricularia grisea TaxID=148305 RepID=A0A6P8BHJ1_PYRGI|nr:uncharacterized protein PgNI_00917 [Pyricularia grisea]KAI6377750.1 hypothetical protein MCOR25_002473 [Pyricularia grisea]TLD16346.1 hypothetical protein PgNI_00917 [Pyricularia grisea]